MGGYSNTLIYTYSGSCVPPTEITRATSLLNIALQLGVFLAIGIQYAATPFLSK